MRKQFQHSINLYFSVYCWSLKRRIKQCSQMTIILKYAEDSLLNDALSLREMESLVDKKSGQFTVLNNKREQV